MASNSAGATQRIAADGKSGFSNADVLEKAEEGDEVRLEFMLRGSMPDAGPHSVISTVKEASEKEETDRIRRRELTLETTSSAKFQVMWVDLLYDTESAMNNICREVTYTEDGCHGSGMMDVQGVEVVKP